MVGSELLSGKVQDENSFSLARTLRSLGVSLERVVTLPDDQSAIASEVRDQAARFDVVFTSGGVGPTHDDVTVDAVAEAFGVGTCSSPELEALLSASYGQHYHSARQRMALIPETAHLVTSPDVSWPTIVMRNVWLLPGVPEIFRMKLSVVKSCLRGSRRFASRAVYTQLEEVALKGFLDRLVREHPRVQIGSYPKWFSPLYKTKITFDALRDDDVQAALTAFLRQLPEGEPQKLE